MSPIRTELWERVGPLEELAPGTLRTFKRDGHQLVVCRASDGEVHALDNRCPHEGYPLASGELKGKALTCCWHNWKFDVRTGRCTLGGEDVRAYPVRVSAGTIEVDLSEPDPEERCTALSASLAEGLRRHENGRAIRDGVRLLSLGYDPWRLLADIARYDALHAEYGTTHVLAVAADCGRVLARYPGVEAMYAIAPAIDLCGETNLRLAPRERPAMVAAPPGETGTRLRAAAEAEDAALAEGLLIAAIEGGAPRADVEGWLYAVLSDHFLDFGHPLIYLVKGGELLDRAGDEYAADVYPALLHSIVLGTREDTLPYMRPYAERLRAVEAELPRLYGKARRDAAFDPARVRDAVLDGRSEEAFDAVLEALEEGVPAAAIARALVGAAAFRLLRFDLAHELDPAVAENWLWATHRFTFAAAVRNAVERFDSPDALRFLFQAVAFVHSGRAMDAPPGRRVALEPEEAGLADVLAAVAVRDPARAVARGLGYLQAGAPVRALREAIEDLCLRDPVVRPIVVAHAIKTSFAAFEEHGALEGHPDQAVPVCAALRLLASPIIERRVFHAVTTSIRWVVHGEVPRKLTQ